MRTIKEVETIMGLTLLDWQRMYLTIWRDEGYPPLMTRGRQCGRTTLETAARLMFEDDA